MPDASRSWTTASCPLEASLDCGTRPPLSFDSNFWKERIKFCSSIPSLPTFKRDRIVLLYLTVADSYAGAAASSVSSLPCLLPNSTRPPAVTSFIRRFLREPRVTQLGHQFRGFVGS